MSVFDLIALLLALTAVFAWVNHRYLKLPPSIGILVMGLAASFLLVLLELAVPNVALYAEVAELVRQIDFQTTVMNGLLAFLLFAGSLHVDFAALRSRVAVVGRDGNHGRTPFHRAGRLGDVDIAFLASSCRFCERWCSAP